MSYAAVQLFVERAAAARALHGGAALVEADLDRGTHLLPAARAPGLFQAEHIHMFDFELEDTDGRRRRLSEFRGRPVVLVVVGGPAREAAAQTGARLARGLSDTDAVVVAVADMRGVPRLMRGVVRGAVRAGMRQAHVEAAHQVPDMPPDTWDRFTLLLDWDGTAVDALDLRGQTDRFHVLVLDRQGRERGHLIQGDAPTDALVDSIVRLAREA